MLAWILKKILSKEKWEELHKEYRETLDHDIEAMKPRLVYVANELKTRDIVIIDVDDCNSYIISAFRKYIRENNHLKVDLLRRDGKRVMRFSRR